MAAGDEAALGTLYDRWAERVHSIALWILKDEDEAEDVVEETFWQVWRTATAYDATRSAASTWLTMIARSRALDRLRGRKRRADWMAAPSTVSALREQTAITRPERPDLELESVDTRAELASVLGALPPEQRSALEMAYFEGLSHSEIAHRTCQPLGTVKTRLRLALEKLREAYRSVREASP